MGVAVVGGWTPRGSLRKALLPVFYWIKILPLKMGNFIRQAIFFLLLIVLLPLKGDRDCVPPRRNCTGQVGVGKYFRGGAAWQCVCLCVSVFVCPSKVRVGNRFSTDAQYSAGR